MTPHSLLSNTLVLVLLLHTSYAYAGGSQSRPNEEEQNPPQVVRQPVQIVEDAVCSVANPLKPIIQQDAIIKTRSQRPILQQQPQQNARHATIDVLPAQQSAGAQESRMVPNEDRRVRVEATAIWPTSTHGVLVSEFTSAKKYGSGTLIASNVILTAAHNLYDSDNRQTASVVEFYPAINETALPFGGPIRSREFFFPEAHKAPGSPEDYAIVILDTYLGERTGYFGLHILPPEQVLGLNLSLRGYPYDKSRLVEERRRAYEMWGMGGSAYSADSNYIRYSNIDTTDGQSGSAVYYQEGDDCYIVGVHALGQEEADPYNRATILTRARYDQINRWLVDSPLMQAKIRETIRNTVHEGITELDLSDKPLGDAGVQELLRYRLPRLVTLKVRNSQVGDVGAQAISQLQSLTNLDASHNNIGNVGARAVAQLPDLAQLNLSSNKIHHEGQQEAIILGGPNNGTWFGQLPQRMHYLDASNNPMPLSVRIIGDISQLENLTHLNLSGMALTEDNPIDILSYSEGLCRNLRHLDLSYTRLSPKKVRNLRNFTQLTWLSLEGNNTLYWGSQSQQWLYELSNLTHLNIRGPDIIEYHAGQIRNALPHLVSFQYGMLPQPESASSGSGYARAVPPPPPPHFYRDAPPARLNMPMPDPVREANKLFHQLPSGLQDRVRADSRFQQFPQNLQDRVSRPMPSFSSPSMSFGGRF